MFMNPRKENTLNRTETAIDTRTLNYLKSISMLHVYILGQNMHHGGLSRCRKRRGNLEASKMKCTYCVERHHNILKMQKHSDSNS